MGSLLSLYQKLEQKVKEEKSLIKAENYGELKKILAEKNNLITEIKEKDAAFKKSGQKRMEKSQLQNLKKLLTKTAEMQNQNLQIISLKKEKTKKKILQLYNRSKSIKGYHNRGHQEAKFFDEKS